MKKNFKKAAGLLLAATLCLAGITACGNKTNTANNAGNKTNNTNQTQEDTNADNSENANTENTTDELSGSITMAGSTSMEKFCTALNEAFMGINKNVTINAEYIGSSAGVEALVAGSAQIGNVSRALKESELSEGVIENIVAIDGIAVIVDKNNTVTDLTKDQLTQIYKGEVKNWSDLGGTNMPIVVVGREAGSGTRGAFEEILAVEEACVYANELDSTGAVMAKVASTPGAIGYVSLDVLDDTVIAVNLEGVAPTADKIKAGEYFLNRPFVMATKGEISTQSKEVQAIFEYLASDEGKTLIESVGLINVD